MPIFIMAQGKQKRLPTIATRKQFLLVDGEPIIRRTLRQLGENNIVAPIVVGWRDMALRLPIGQSPGSCSLLVLEDPGYCILDGIRQTQDSWGDEPVLILLGDVCYSNAAIGQLLARAMDAPPGRAPFNGSTHPFFTASPDLGRGGGETFALYVPYDHAEVHTALDTVPCRGIDTGDRYQPGHLRNLLWRLMEMRGLGPDYVLAGAEYHSSLVHPIYDWTTDIDTVADLEKLPHLTECARRERCG